MCWACAMCLSNLLCACGRTEDATSPASCSQADNIAPDTVVASGSECAVAYLKGLFFFTQISWRQHCVSSICRPGNYTGSCSFRQCQSLKPQFSISQSRVEEMIAAQSLAKAASSCKFFVGRWHAVTPAKIERPECFPSGLGWQEARMPLLCSAEHVKS